MTPSELAQAVRDARNRRKNAGWRFPVLKRGCTPLPEAECGYCGAVFKREGVVRQIRKESGK